MKMLSSTKHLLALIALLLIINQASAQLFGDTTAITLPLGGNGWLNKNARAKIGEKGLTKWSTDADVISVYVRPELTGIMDIALNLRVPEGTTSLAVIVGNITLSQNVTGGNWDNVDFGKVNIKTPGYVQIKIQGLSKSGSVYADISDVVLSGPAVLKGAAYVKDNKGNYFYWGHRGPSVHLNYTLPDEAKKQRRMVL
jgi:hypothetical protein